MGKITKLTPQKHNRERVNVFLDGAFAFGLALALATQLHVGQELTEAEIAALATRDTVEKAREAVWTYVSYRPRSQAEIERHLAKKKYAPEVIEAVVAQLRETSVIDDEAFARYWVDQRESFRPRSRIALRQELSQKGVDRAVVDAVLAEVDEDAAALRAVEAKARRWRELPDDEYRRKVQQFLGRRGFPYGIIKETLSRLEAEREPDEWPPDERSAA